MFFERFLKINLRKPFRKLNFYLYAVFHIYLTPTLIHKKYKRHCYQLLSNKTLAKSIFKRVDYYHRHSNYFDINSQRPTSYLRPPFVSSAHINYKRMPSAYYYDFKKILSYFNSLFQSAFIMGDVIKTPLHPAIVKSRPICPNPSNSHADQAILLKLDAVRHFNFVKDNIPFDQKENNLIWRGPTFNEHRKLAVKLYFKNSQYNVAQTGFPNSYGYGKFMSIPEQLKYKFILSIEGNDVATNLKWIMSSNSLCLMAKPRYETWFMEGLLKAGYHYVELRDDFKDLPEKVQYYIDHPAEAKQIIKNANTYTKQFQNKQQEDLISMLVMEKYFHYSKQLVSPYFKPVK